jgi:hypothetical protein
MIATKEEKKQQQQLHHKTYPTIPIQRTIKDIKDNVKSIIRRRKKKMIATNEEEEQTNSSTTNMETSQESGTLP